LNFNLAELKRKKSSKDDAIQSSHSPKISLNLEIRAGMSLTKSENQPSLLNPPGRKSLIQQLDTQEVSRTFKEILKSKKICQQSFSKRLGFISRSRFNDLVKHPLPWAACTDLCQRVYHKMHKWSQSTEETRSLQLTPGSQRVMQQLATSRAVKNIKELLLRHSISRGLFAKKFLNMNHSYFSKLLNRPPAWTKCTDYTKQIFGRMHEWSILPDQIITRWLHEK
jgi:hypothetical protein